MNVVGHLISTLFVSRKPIDLMLGLAPDLANPTFIFEYGWVRESDPRVQASRILHSPLVVVAILLLTRGRGWAYALHWALDVTTHEPYQVFWPFIKES